MRTRILAIFIAFLAAVSPAQANDGRCKALKDFLVMLETAEDMHLGTPMAVLSEKPNDESRFAGFVTAFAGAYTETVLSGLMSLKTAYPEVAAIDASVGGYPAARDKMLALMQEELAGGTGAWEAYEAATVQHEPLGEAFVTWLAPERDRCEGNR